MFVDRVALQLQAGRGGDGAVSFRREKFVPRGGPDGGDGGDGGSVVVVAQPGVDSLAGLSQRRQWKAESGERGGTANCHGRSAADLLIAVPPGTIVYDSRGGFILKDLAKPGDRVIAARGGHGGKGNSRFKSATNRAPRQFSPGEQGEVRDVVLELKVIADVGLIGKPNAGKSTLLSRLSRARPEIADYPFTTKYPNLGMVTIDAERSFVIADIPGLIEGASQGAGLGHEFLRHVERAGILVHLVEPLPVDGSDPVENYRAIRQELGHYDPRLMQRPEIVCVSKGELPGADQVRDRLAAETGQAPLTISAVTGHGLNVLIGSIAGLLEAQRQPAEAEA
ncbi:MAG TPA: GTPase ObgE [Pirellulales bacterium]|nr:GTPase ObgE [Pirellulales bacterium]